jgi:hypothetical protein
VTDLRNLAALRRAATDGPWGAFGQPAGEAWLVINHGGGLSVMVTGRDTPTPEYDATYIAAAGNISADEWEALAALVEAARALVDGLGWWTDGSDERVTWPVDADGCGDAEGDGDAVALRAALAKLDEVGR